MASRIDNFQTVMTNTEPTNQPSNNVSSWLCQCKLIHEIFFSCYPEDNFEIESLIHAPLMWDLTADA